MAQDGQDWTLRSRRVRELACRQVRPAGVSSARKLDCARNTASCGHFIERSLSAATAATSVAHVRRITTTPARAPTILVKPDRDSSRHNLFCSHGPWAHEINEALHPDEKRRRELHDTAGHAFIHNDSSTAGPPNSGRTMLRAAVTQSVSVHPTGYQSGRTLSTQTSPPWRRFRTILRDSVLCRR
jgi:hypothetical protein